MGSERVVPELDRCPARHFGTSGRSRRDEASPDGESGLNRARKHQGRVGFGQGAAVPRAGQVWHFKYPINID
jgi:hypothetical protein